MNKTYVQRNYKDTVFRMLFKEKENLLSLYNALNKTAYTDMPLRNLFYVKKVLQGLTKDGNLYSQSLVKLPTPRFVVFYNGTVFQPGVQILRLSEAFEKRQKEIELELLVTVYNINWGQNPELLGTCCLLKEYAKYVERVRNYAKKLPFPEAVELAVDDCIKEGVLAEFLSKNRAEAIAMSIFEYDEEAHMKSEREWAYKNGHEEGERVGFEKGQVKGEQRLAKLLQILTEEGRSEEISRILSDSAYRKQLYEENNL